MAKGKKNKKQLKKKIFLFFILALCLFGISYASLNYYINTPKNVKYTPVDLNLENVRVLFTDKNSLYEANLNGGYPKKIATVPRIITSFDLLESGEIAISATGRYVGDGTLKKGWSYEDEGEEVYAKYWVVDKNGKLLVYEDGEYFEKLAMDDTSYYTQEKADGSADIIYRSLNGKTEIVGNILEPVDEYSPCHGETVRSYPREFTSYNGKYLFGRPSRGGGICSSTSHVFSRDGSSVYELPGDVIDSVWIGEDQMLVSYASGDNIDILKFNDEGETSHELLGNYTGEFRFSAANLSPSKKYLLWTIQSNLVGPNGSAIYEVSNKKIRKIGDEDGIGNGSWSEFEDILLVDLPAEGDLIKKLIYDPKTNKKYEFINVVRDRDTNLVVRIF